jgi:hypothetical protein
MSEIVTTKEERNLRVSVYNFNSCKADTVVHRYLPALPFRVTQVFLESFHFHRSIKLANNDVLKSQSFKKISYKRISAILPAPHDEKVVFLK